MKRMVDTEELKAVFKAKSCGRWNCAKRITADATLKLIDTLSQPVEPVESVESPTPMYQTIGDPIELSETETAQYIQRTPVRGTDPSGEPNGYGCNERDDYVEKNYDFIITENPEKAITHIEQLESENAVLKTQRERVLAEKLSPEKYLEWLRQEAAK